MSDEEVRKVIEQIESELNGDPEHDADVWNSWGDRYREQPDSEPLLREIGKHIFDLFMEEEGDLPRQIFNDMVDSSDEDFDEACALIEEKQYEDALSKLLVLTELVKNYPLSDDMEWKDFDSYLDALVYQDYYEEEIGGREIARHPMHPGKILYTCGSLLVEMNRPEEALEPLEMLMECDPVCPKYLFELGEAYKRSGRIGDAYNTAMWALACASNRTELARGYRDLAFCLSESGAYEDALMLYLLSLHYQSSRFAETEIAWIRKKSGLTADGYSDETIRKRCGELNIPIGISETVQRNINFLKMIDENKIN